MSLLTEARHKLALVYDLRNQAVSCLSSKGRQGRSLSSSDVRNAIKCVNGIEYHLAIAKNRLKDLETNLMIVEERGK